MVLKAPFGYRKLTKEEAKSDRHGPVGLRIAKDPRCTSTIREMADRILRGETYEAIARWLNGRGIKPGSYVVNGRWTGRLVQALLRNALLHGEREFRKSICKTIYKTGKQRRERNTPDKYERESYLELAHLSVDEHRQLLEAMDRKAEKLRRPEQWENSRYRMPRSQTVFPRQHATCGICNALMYTVDRDRLLCSRALAGDCWNRVRPRESQVRQKVIDVVLAEADRHPEFKRSLMQSIKEELARAQTEKGRQVSLIEKQLGVTDSQIEAITAAIAESDGELPSLLGKLQQLETRRDGLSNELDKAKRAMNSEPISVADDEIEAQLQRIICHLAETSHEFADLMREVLPILRLFPVQALNTPQVRSIARFQLEWPSDPRSATEVPGTGDDENWVEVNLFDPPQHVRDCLVIRESKRLDGSLKQIAQRHGLTKARAHRALQYLEEMRRAGTSRHYRELDQPPKTASRWRKVQRSEDGEEVLNRAMPTSVSAI